MLFDTHAHYDAPEFDQDRDALLARLPEQDVSLVVNPGCDPASSRAALELAGRYPFLYAAVGWHPENCAPYDGSLDVIRELAQAPRTVAIGEIGLDYYWEENPPREHQQRVFRDQVALAEELGLPVIVHDREAHADSLSIVREFPRVRGVFHCYSGSAEDAKTLVALGWHLSFTGTITFKNARKGPEVVAAVPMERLMVETDAPYMAPVPFRGKRCDSRYVYRMAEAIGDIKGLPVEEVARITTENGKRLFGID